MGARLNFNRRSLLRAAGLSVVAVSGAGALTGCKGGDDGSGRTAKVGNGSVDADRLKELLGVESGTEAGDVDFTLGAVLALSGPGAFYGKAMTKGIELAAAQIKSAGGPSISIEYLDNKSGSAQAGANSTRQLGSKRISACLSSYVGSLGSMLPGVEQYKILTLDGGGGTSNFAQGKDYFWGMKAVEPDDYFPGVVQYWQQAFPDISKVSLVAIDQGQVNDVVLENFTNAFKGAGMSVASAEFTPIGTTDFTSTLGKIKSAAPDAIFIFLVGNDAGYFMKGLESAGLQVPVVGAEYTPDARKAAAGAFDLYTFCTDYFLPEQEGNPLKTLFVESYVEAYGEQPDYYAANYWEDTMAVWDLIRRTEAAGGNVESGEDLQKALVGNPTFKSVYGGTASEVGTIKLDPDSHSVTERPLGIYTCSGDSVTEVATFGVGGADFAMTPA